MTLDSKLLNYLWTEVRLAQGLPTLRPRAFFRFGALLLAYNSAVVLNR
jgi:hypothetical protein